MITAFFTVYQQPHNGFYSFRTYRLFTVLARTEDEVMTLEEMDVVQLELEMLLSAVALRYRNLQEESESLDKEDVKKKKNDKPGVAPATVGAIPGKRKREDGGKKGKLGVQPMKLAKLKNASANSPVHSQHTDDSMDGTGGSGGAYGGGTADNPTTKMLVPKNDVPNKFWLSVEPYCMPLTQEDIRVSECRWLAG